MESSRNSKSNESLSRRVAALLARAAFPGAHLVLGFSGGVDSTTLLSILAELAPAMRFSLRAVHVNHGLSPNAGEWADFCAELCRKLQIPLQVEKVDIAPYRGLGLEGAARHARREVFARIDADFLVLAQHRDDQAETLMLRLLRGAGLSGLTGMSALGAFSGARARLLRPLLEISRAEIESHARERGLQWIEDESNTDTIRRRNFLRHEVFPLIERRFPAARAAVARAADHLAEARDLLAEMARADFDACSTGDGTIEIPSLLRLRAARAKNLVRFWCEARDIPVPTRAQLEELLRQLRESGADMHVRLRTSRWQFLRHRSKLYLQPLGEPAKSDFVQDWNGENALPLLALGGVLKFKPEEGRGLSLAKLRQARVTVRLRQGGEHLRPDPRRPRRTLKNLLRERGIVPWLRDRLPLLFCGEELVSVPGVADACEFRAAPGERGLMVSWERFGQESTRG
jgi:tRNA(Ile)-lysidine synthase